MSDDNKRGRYLLRGVLGLLVWCGFVVVSLKVPLMMASSINCLFFNSSSPSACSKQQQTQTVYISFFSTKQFKSSIYNSSVTHSSAHHVRVYQVNHTCEICTWHPCKSTILWPSSDKTYPVSCIRLGQVPGQ